MVRLSRDKRDAKNGLRSSRSALKLIQIDETFGQRDNNAVETCPADEQTQAPLSAATAALGARVAALEAELAAKALQHSNVDAAAVLVARVAALEEQLATKDRHLSQLQSMLTQSMRAQDASPASRLPVGPWAWSRIGPLVAAGELGEEETDATEQRQYPSSASDEKFPPEVKVAATIEEQTLQETTVASGRQCTSSASDEKFPPEGHVAATTEGQTPQEALVPVVETNTDVKRHVAPASPAPRRARPTSPAAQRRLPQRPGGKQGASPRGSHVTSPRRTASPRRSHGSPPPEKSLGSGGSSRGALIAKPVQTRQPVGGCVKRPPGSSAACSAGSSVSLAVQERSSGSSVSVVVQERSPPKSCVDEEDIEQLKRELQQLKDVDKPATPCKAPADQAPASSSPRTASRARSSCAPRPGSPSNQRIVSTPATKTTATGTPVTCRTSPWRTRGPSSGCRRPPPTPWLNGRRNSTANSMASPPPPVGCRTDQVSCSQGAASSARQAGRLGMQRDYSGTWLSVEEQLKLNTARCSPSNLNPPSSVASASAITATRQEPIEIPESSDDFVRIERLVNDGSCHSTPSGPATLSRTVGVGALCSSS